MQKNHFTLFHRTKNLNKILQNAKWQSCFTHQKNKIECDFYTKSGFVRLVFNAQNTDLFYFQRTELLSLPKKRINLFQEWIGGTVISCDLHETERVFRIKIMRDNAENYLIFQCIPAKGNVFFATKTESFYFKKNTPKIKIDEWKSASQNTYRKMAFNLGANVKNLEKLTFQDWVKNNYSIFAGALTREIAHRSQIFPETSEISEKNAHSTGKVVAQIAEECLQPSPNFALGKFNLILMQHRENGDICSDLEIALQEFSQNSRMQNVEKEKNRILHALQIKMRKLERKLPKLKNQLEESQSADRWQHFGDILLANSSTIPSGTKNFTFEGEIIKLDSTLSPIKNAQNYYNRAKKSRRSGALIDKQINDTLAEMEKTQKLHEELQTLHEKKEISTWIKKHNLELKTQSDAKFSERKSYKQFEFQGWNILIGRSSKDNDHLTLKIAKPADLWLHAQGVGGSHVIIQNPQKKEIPKSVIEFAARLAAKNSRAKHSGIVPVIYTWKKYVTKPRKTLPGIVRVEREKSVFVELDK